jgi:mycothiol S-conjugate amidase
MAVHAHPDDESSKGAATMARYRAEGVKVLVVTCTGGERGDILNPAMDCPEIKENIGAVRRAEMARARAILGVQQTWLGFVDSGLPCGDPRPPLSAGCFATQPLAVAAAPLVRAIRSFRPHVIVTYDEHGGYPHPDHVMCHKISVEAFGAAGDPAGYPGTGAPWQPLKLYYHVAFHQQRFQAERRAMLARGLLAFHCTGMLEGRPDPQARWPITSRVRCGDYFEVRDRALRAHATQIDPDGPWLACPTDVAREAWPTEDYHLALSLVGSALPEDDLFAGCAEGAAADQAYRERRTDLVLSRDDAERAAYP